MRRVTVVGVRRRRALRRLRGREGGGAGHRRSRRASTIGGTTALSGGNGWFPANRHVPDDTPEQGLAYLRALSLGDSDDALLQVFAREAGPVGRADRARDAAGAGSRSRTPTTTPSSRAAASRAAARWSRCRSIRRPASRRSCATRRTSRRPSPTSSSRPARSTATTLAKRKERGTFTLGPGADRRASLEACLDAGVRLETGTRVQALPDADAVVLATGGFERDPQLARAFLRGPMLAPVGAPSARGRRPAARDRRRRPARLDERGLVVPRGADPGRHDRRRADVPADPDRAGATGLPARQRPRRALRRRGAELQRPRPRPAELRADVVLVPERAGLARASTAATARRTASARSRAATPTPTGWRAARRPAELAAEIGVPGRRARGDDRALQRGRRPRGGSRLRPRQLPVRPLHRRSRAAGAGRPTTPSGCCPGCLGTKGGPKTDDARPGALDHGRQPDPGPLRGGERGGEPVRPRLPRRRRARSALPSCSGSGRARRRPGTEAAGDRSARSWPSSISRRRAKSGRPRCDVARVAARVARVRPDRRAAWQAAERIGRTGAPLGSSAVRPCLYTVLYGGNGDREDS